MDKFIIEYSEITYYLATEIKAYSREEARDKFIEKLNEGDILVTETEQYAMNIKETK